MAVEAFPFAGPDRPWGAPEWREFMAQMREGGIIEGFEDECLVEAIVGDLQVRFRPGMAFVAGHQVRVVSAEIVDLETADLEDDRVDLAVLTTDWRQGERRAYTEVLTGVPGVSPVAPTPQQDDLAAAEGIYQEPLAEVVVPAAAGEPGPVTDRRQMMTTPGRVLVVGSEVELDGVDPTFHRLAVVDPEGADGQARWYDTDSGTWKVIGPVGNVLVVESELELDGYSPPEQRFAVVDGGGGTGALYYYRTDTSEWVRVTAEGLPEDQADAKYVLQRLKIDRSNKDSDGVFRDVIYRRHDGTAWMESRLRPEASGPEYDTREVDWFEADGVTVRASAVYDLTYDADGDLTQETIQP